MKREVLAKSIKQIINEHLTTKLNHYSYDGENLFLTQDLKIDLLDKLEILNKIEEKYHILINDENIIWKNDLTVGQYIDKIFEQIQNK